MVKHEYPHFNPTTYNLNVKIATVRTGSHCKFNINYHIIWIPKYRKKVLTGKRTVCTTKEIRRVVIMVKEVNYVVLPSLISPQKRIYAGVIMEDKRGRGVWKTRGDVTGMVNNAFLEHFVAKTKEDNPKGNGMKYEFYDVKDYNVKILLTKVLSKIDKNKSFTVTHSKANFLSKEDVKNSKKKHFVTLEEHEKLYREKEYFRKELEKSHKTEVA